MKEIDEYLKSRVGKTWRMEDHDWLCVRLDKIDALAKAAANLRAYTQGTRQDRAAAKEAALK